jgi:N-acetylglutamate synthase-like GNAT family acetyltransferase
MPEIIYKKLEFPEVEETKKLILEYVRWLGVDLSFQGIQEEMKQFPHKYKEPDGAFWIAKENHQIVACVGMKKLEPKICEMKRLYVQNEYKGKKIGKKLIALILEEAREKGYQKIRLDTVPEQMLTAYELYRKFKFYEISAYVHNPMKGVKYLEKIL